MNSPCDTCAFGNNGAAQEPANAIKSQICAFGAIPFWCHHGKDGQEYDWQNSVLGPMTLAPTNRKVCGGWQRQVSLLANAGYFRKYGLFRRIVGRAAFKAFEIFTTPEMNLHKKERANRKLERCLKFLIAKDVDDMEIPL